MALLCIKQHWPLVISVRIIQTVICITPVCMQVWTHLCLCKRTMNTYVQYNISVRVCFCRCVYVAYFWLCFFMCVCVHTVCAAYVHVCLFFHIWTIMRTLDLSTESVYRAWPWGVCVCVCLIMVPGGLGLPLMRWRPTGVKQVQSGAWALPINPFHRVIPNIIAWGAGGHWAMACPA